MCLSWVFECSDCETEYVVVVRECSDPLKPAGSNQCLRNPRVEEAPSSQFKRRCHSCRAGSLGQQNSRSRDQSPSVRPPSRASAAASVPAGSATRTAPAGDQTEAARQVHSRQATRQPPASGPPTTAIHNIPQIRKGKRARSEDDNADIPTTAAGSGTLAVTSGSSEPGNSSSFVNQWVPDVGDMHSAQVKTREPVPECPELVVKLGSGHPYYRPMAFTAGQAKVSGDILYGQISGEHQDYMGVLDFESRRQFYDRMQRLAKDRKKDTLSQQFFKGIYDTYVDGNPGTSLTRERYTLERAARKKRNEV